MLPHCQHSGTSPYRVKIRVPTFDTILAALPKVLKGAKLADVVARAWYLGYFQYFGTLHGLPPQPPHL